MFRRGWGKCVTGIAVFALISVLTASFAFAGCPDGESARSILLPNGIETKLCVPDIPVSDQSEDIVTGICPSLNDEDITYSLGKGVPSGCWYNVHALLCCS